MSRGSSLALAKTSFLGGKLGLDRQVFEQEKVEVKGEEQRLMLCKPHTSSAMLGRPDQQDVLQAEVEGDKADLAVVAANRSSFVLNGP